MTIGSGWTRSMRRSFTTCTVTGAVGLVVALAALSPLASLAAAAPAPQVPGPQAVRLTGGPGG